MIVERPLDQGKKMQLFLQFPSWVESFSFLTFRMTWARANRVAGNLGIEKFA